MSLIAKRRDIRVRKDEGKEIRKGGVQAEDNIWSALVR